MAFSAPSPENKDRDPNNYAEYALRYRFNRIFSHGWDFIIKDTPESKWRSVKKFNLTEPKSWYKYTDEEAILGLRFGTETTHGLYDIDIGSIHDPREQEESLRQLKAELELWGIFSFVLLQSSFSQGLHLYFFFDRPVNTFRLACVMNKAAEDAGLEIKRGQLETFPNTKRYNNLFNGHRLPLQQGSYLLDKDYTPYSARLEDFLDAADWSAARNDTDLLESRLEEAYEWFKAKKNQERTYNPSPEDREFLEQVDYAQREIKEGFLNQIRIQIEQGFSGEHETNELLLTIAKLGRILYGLSGQRYIDYIRETIMSCPGYARYCRHKHEINRRCEEVARYGEKQWYPYRSRLPQDRPTYKYIKESLSNQTNLNLERQHKASSRIIQAVTHIEREKGGLPNKVGECKLAIRNVTKELFGLSVSDATLTKPENLPLWHPKYRKVEPNPDPQGAAPQESQHPEEEPEVTVEVKAEEVKEQETTDTPTPVPEAAPSSSSQNNTIEPNNGLETLDSIDLLQKDDKKVVIQEVLHSEQGESKKHKDRATPCHVTRQNGPNPKTPKFLPSLVSTISCHTLPLMKGVMAHHLIEFIFQIIQRAYYEAIMISPRLEFLYQGYRGFGTSGFVRRKGDKQSLVQSIPPNTEVEILRKDRHSSYFRENPKQLLVYIKPLYNADDWQQGIAVLIDHLIPIRIRD